MPSLSSFNRSKAILTLLLLAGSVFVSAQQVMPEPLASHFCQLLIDDGNSVAPLSYHAHRLITQKNDSLTAEQLFAAFIFRQDNWRQMRLFPHCDDKGKVVWYAPLDDIPECVGTEHIKYIREVMPRLNAVIQAGNWEMADDCIKKMIEYQCRFGATEAASAPTMPSYLIYILLLILFAIVILPFSKGVWTGQWHRPDSCDGRGDSQINQGLNDLR